jgi:hypothetical protein
VIGLLASSLDIEVYKACVYSLSSNGITDKYLVSPSTLYLPEQLILHFSDNTAF